MAKPKFKPGDLLKTEFSNCTTDILITEVVKLPIPDGYEYKWDFFPPYNDNGKMLYSGYRNYKIIDRLSTKKETINLEGYKILYGPKISKTR